MLRTPLSLAGILFGNMLLAASAAELCPSRLEVPARPFVGADLQEGDIHLSSDEADLEGEGVSTLVGNAEITRDDRQARADRIEYYSEQNLARFYGNINYWERDLFLRSDSGYIEFDQETGAFHNVAYVFTGNRLRGNAEGFALDAGAKTRISGVANHTSCDPGNQFWALSADRISLDHAEEWGSARNVVLRIKDIPVFYAPYLSFPLSARRKTGLLIPSYRNSTRNGFELISPFYWNISPAMDATITPHVFLDEGVMVAGEYRYLLQRGRGSVNFEYLPDDSEFSDEDRGLFGMEYEQSFLDSGKVFLDYKRVSDRHYFEDFGNQLGLSSTQFLHQRAGVSYRSGDLWDVAVNLDGYQIVDGAVRSRPYKRLPQLLFGLHSRKENRSLNYGVKSEVAHFERDTGADDVQGLRVDLEPYVAYPINAASGYIHPRLAVSVTRYNLSESGTLPDSPDRALPVLSLDSGVFLERTVRLLDKSYLQTLEPRLFYVYVPKKDQSDLPVFDTGLYEFSFSSLFRARRFNNPDRLGDANRLSLAFRSHLHEVGTGRQIAYIGLGQIYYFRDREITLPNSPVGTESSSPVVAEIGAEIMRRWSVKSDVQWDPHSGTMEKLAARLRYHSGNGGFVDLGYRYRMSDDIVDIEQSDISFHWPFSPQWGIVGHWKHALTAGQPLEIFGGIEYKSCCWEARAVMRRFLAGIDGEFETGVFLQIELAGLAGVGDKTARFLQQYIPGY